MKLRYLRFKEDLKKADGIFFLSELGYGSDEFKSKRVRIYFTK